MSDGTLIVDLRPQRSETEGANPSFLPLVDDEGFVTDFEPTEHFLGNHAKELLNRQQVTVIAAAGVADIRYHGGLVRVVDDAGIAGFASDGETPITITFDAGASVTLLHRVVADEREMAETAVVPGVPFVPTLADVASALEVGIDVADLNGQLPFAYLDGAQLGNHLFVKASDGMGGEGGYYRIAVDRIDDEQFNAILLVTSGALDAEGG